MSVRSSLRSSVRRFFDVGARRYRVSVQNLPFSTSRLLACSAASSPVFLETLGNTDGNRACIVRGMRGARHFSELTVWKLADELRVETLKLTGRPEFARNLKAQTQAEDAVNSVCRNIAEGFGCESHGQFAWYLRISRRSLNELQDAFRGAEQKGYVTSDDRAPTRGLTRRLYPALNRFIAYLDSTPDYRPNHGNTRPARPAQPPRNPTRTDARSSDRTDSRSGPRTNPRSEPRTDSRQTDRTDERSENRTGPYQTDRTDKRSEDRTDPRKTDRTD